MNVHPLVNLIAYMWKDITAISQILKVEKTVEKKQMIEFRPTISMISSYLDHKNWDIIPIERNECFYLISLFHTTYLSAGN